MYPVINLFSGPFPSFSSGRAPSNEVDPVNCTCYCDLICMLSAIHVRAVSKCIVMMWSWRDHITPILKQLYWLPVNQRIKFKILVFAFKCLNDSAPVYLSDLISHYKPSRKLRSSSFNNLVVQDLT